MDFVFPLPVLLVGLTPKEILNESIILQTLQPNSPLEISYWEENVPNLLKVLTFKQTFFIQMQLKTVLIF